MLGNLEEFTLERKYRPDEATLGKLSDKDNKELCKTLENPWLDNESGISCIPEGDYICEEDNTGNHQYWKVVNVPDRGNVEIHIGNKSIHTKGCILFGMKWTFMDDELAVSGSEWTLNRLKNNKILPSKFKLKIYSRSSNSCPADNLELYLQ